MQFNILNTNAERSLAHVEEIANITPIPGADRIAMAQILGWRCIIAKEEFNIGDKCIYFEIDSLVNKEDERFAFLEKKNYKVKTMKLGKFNVISQGLAMPLSEFPELGDLPIGTDVTKKLKVTYYNAEDRKRKSARPDPDAKYKSMAARHKELFCKRPIRWLMRRVWGKKLLFVFFGKRKDNPKKFPNWIQKTDENRCLHRNTKVLTEEGLIRIGLIVNKKLDVKVKSVSPNGDIEYKRILDYQKINPENTIKITYRKGPYTKRNKLCSGNSNSIICSYDHMLLTTDGYKKAKDISFSDNLLLLEKAYPDEAIKLLYGISIGDSHLAFDKRCDSLPRLSFMHGEDQLDYLNEKKRLLGIKKSSALKGKSGYGEKSIYSSYAPIDKKYVLSLYDDNAIVNHKLFKSVDFCNRLSPHSLAIWYLDDGTLRHRDNGYAPAIEFSTHSETVEEIENLINALERFGIKAKKRIAKKRGIFMGYTIALNTDSTDKFLKLVTPYIPYCMRYKTTNKYKDVKYVCEDVVYSQEERLIPVSIIDISKNKNEYLYDITVEDNHNFIANGIVSHNCENIPWVINDDINWSVSEKLDGTSSTFALEKTKKGYDFIVCSRNVRQKDRDQECYHESNVYWEMADKYAIEQKLRIFAKKNNVDKMYLQGETVGEKLQGNPYHMGVRNFYAFNLWVDGKRYTNEELFEWCDQYCIPHVPLIYEHHQLPDNMEDMKAEAEGKSLINPSVLREGLVYRASGDPWLSFKNVSNSFLLKKQKKEEKEECSDNQN